MKKIIKYKKLFAYSSKNNKYFYTEFSDGINLVYGKNTSGKSTLIQSILYTFGINDGKYKLKEILEEEVIFRLDFVLIDNITENISIIRDNDLLIIKREKEASRKFFGIGADNSNEHIMLKSYLADIFGFSLYLQILGSYKPASIEAMFLPYYVAQDVGWVSRHKSFRNLEFIRDFKYDFFDYYLGIFNNYDKDKKQQLELIKKQLQNEINFLKETEQKNDKLQLAKLKDEKYIAEANEYLKNFKENKAKLIELEREYINICNKLSFEKERKKLLSKVKRSLDKQSPLIDKCPTCNQSFPNQLTDIYEYHQNINDTYEQIKEINELLGDLKSKINSYQKKMNELKNTIASNYSVLSLYKIDDLTFSSWVDNKANIKLSENILQNLGLKEIELGRVLKSLSKFKTDEEIEKERSILSFKFANIFKKFIKDLGVKQFDEERYYLLYKMPTFPKQGVELIKTILAYNFAFVDLISQTPYIHQLPLLLDAIFKEDIDEKNKGVILDFIYKNRKISNQMIITISDSEDNVITAPIYNDQFLNNEAKLICINNARERAFLSDFNEKHLMYLEETLSFMEL